MNMGRLSDVLVGAAGDVAGTVVDPRAGLGRLRAAASASGMLTLTAGLLLGYLAARSRWRG
ncbi:hypothetical protein QTQ03_06685 [Micromonospora sp. WMMA1363]|uniref:hypothetical protein n=1 Tax=Micromonospora sp. WMMA1363 TaxID=3053985 RepID=UPI00259D1DF8|nr:hypothetical protein [Micromonospora sp. WMMA1363]MDM4719298.1 hypothetical protein [Micromonospora sp. WMMA1363]